MSATHRAAALAVALAAGLGCENLQTQRPTLPSPTPRILECDGCGDPTTYQAHIFKVEAPGGIRAGKPATFTIYLATGLDKLNVCDQPDPQAQDEGWGVSDDGKVYTLGVLVQAVRRDEKKPCAFIDRNVPPKAVVVKKDLTFPRAGTYQLAVTGYDGVRPLGMTWSPGPGDPDTPPAPSKPNTIEVAP